MIRNNSHRPTNAHLNIVYWRDEQFWLGKLVDRPEIMSRGETLEELEENPSDARREMLLCEA